MIRVGDSVAGIHMDSELKQRKIGHSDEVDGGNQENTYIHNSFALDAGYANYIRETVPKTVWSNDYLRELWDENAKYLKSIRESKNGYGFDDIGMGAAYAYSCLLYTSPRPRDSCASRMPSSA